MNKLAFLFGAGISIPAGLPSTKQITERVLSGEGIFRDSDGSYNLDTLVTYFHSEATLSRVLKFLIVIKQEISEYYRYLPNREINYEDLYYVANQVFDSLTKNFDNPVLGGFIDKIWPKLINSLDFVGEDLDEQKLMEISSETIEYIADVVCGMLNQLSGNINHLDCLREAILDDGLEHIDIFTLNHDVLIEEYLGFNGKVYTDGFGKEINGVRWWNSKLFDSQEKRIRLLKLHGSVNWYWLHTKRDGGGFGNIGIVKDGDHWHARNPQNEMVMSIEHRPKILAGSFNKMAEYTTGIFADLHYHFHHSLREINHIVVSGYSFGDKGINIKIAEWLFSSDDKRLIVVHRNGDSLRENARGLISNNWDIWLNEGKLILVPKWIQKTSWQDIKNAILSNS